MLRSERFQVDGRWHLIASYRHLFRCTYTALRALVGVKSFGTVAPTADSQSDCNARERGKKRSAVNPGRPNPGKSKIRHCIHPSVIRDCGLLFVPSALSLVSRSDARFPPGPKIRLTPGRLAYRRVPAPVF